MNAHATAPSRDYVSPYVRAAAERCRATVVTDTLANQTTFTIWARHPGQIRLWSVEAPMLQTMAEALEELKQHDRAVMVTQSDPDVPAKDVSEDLARAWLKELWAHGFDPTEENVPAFVGEHLTNDEIERAE